MSDINEWQLAYGATTLDFGLMSTQYPFSTQVEIGDTDISDQDQAHPTADGLVMGKDKLGSFTITFNSAILPPNVPDPDLWTDPLDLFSTFRTKWRADSVRSQPGVYATLSNLNRSRMVYGRPRKCAQKLDRLRKGLISFIHTFDTNGPDWYSTVLRNAVITPTHPAVGGIVAPLTTPMVIAGVGSSTDPVLNAGDLPSWPVIKFHGPGAGHSIALLDGGTVLWEQHITDSLQYDEVLTLDTRPWHRGATINGRPANGRIRGTQIEQLQIPPGDYDLQFKVVDTSATAFAELEWRDTYASM